MVDGVSAGQPALAGNINPDRMPAPQQEGAGQPKFADVWKQIQTEYGAKPEKPREIKKTLGKDDFLNIMITQMKYQDPTQPFKAEQFAQEIAQFTTVEQLRNVNENIGKLAANQQPMERLAMTNLIGKMVHVDRERFPHVEGVADHLTFNLGKDATAAKATIVAENGEPVMERDLGALKSGPNSFSWDGIKTNTLPAKAGTYVLKIEAKDARGANIPIKTQGEGKVVGVSFEGGEPIVLVGDINRPEKVAWKNITRIQDGNGPSPQQMIPGAKTMGQAVAAQQGAPSAGGAAAPQQAAAPPEGFVPIPAGLRVPEQTPQMQAQSAAYAQAQAQVDALNAARRAQPQPQPQQARPQGPGASGPPPEILAQAQAALAKEMAGTERGFPNGLRDHEEPVPSQPATIEKGGEKSK